MIQTESMWIEKQLLWDQKRSEQIRTKIRKDLSKFTLGSEKILADLHRNSLGSEYLNRFTQKSDKI